MKKSFYTAYILFLTTTKAYSGILSTQLTPKQGRVGDSFRLNITIEGELNSKINIPNIDGIVITNSGTSTNVSWINGDYSKTTTLTYGLYPNKKGTYEIPPIKLKVDNKSVETKKITLIVTETSSSVKMTNSDSQTRIFITKNFSNKSLYTGSPTVETIKLYHNVKITDLKEIKRDLSGFRVLNLKEWSSKETKGSTTYNVINIQKVLIPLNSGSFTLPGYKIQAAIVLPKESNRRRQRRFDDFDDFFGFGGFFQSERVSKKVLGTKDTLIKVKPIPIKDRPNNYYGLVGDFRIKKELSKNKIKVGDTTTLTITIDGVGVLDSFSLPKPNFGNDIKIYDDKPKLNEKASKKWGIYSTKVFKYALVPTKEGNISLGKFATDVFRPKLKKFTEISTNLGTLNVEASKDALAPLVIDSSSTQSSARKNAIKNISSDLIDINRYNWDNSLTSKSTKKQTIMWMLGSLFILILSIIYRLFTSKDGKSNRIRRINALKNFETRTKNLNKKIKEEQVNPETISEIYKAYRDYLGDKFSLNGSSLTDKDIEKHFSNIGFETDIINLVKDVSNKINIVEYKKDCDIDKHKLLEITTVIRTIINKVEQKC